MALDVKIIVNKILPQGTLNFGIPLILEENSQSGKDYKEFSNLDELVKIGYTADSKVYKVAQLMFMQDYIPKKIAVCSCTTTANEWLQVENNMKKEWRQLLVISAGDTTTDVASIMTTIEATKKYQKMYFATLDYEDTTEFTREGIERTVLFYYDKTEDLPCPVAAIVAIIAGVQVGSYTVNNMKVKGIEGLELSDSDIDALHKKGGITYVVSAGDVVASEGFSAGGSPHFIDNTDNDDYIYQQLQYKTQKLFNDNLKIPYTDVGIGMLEGVALAVMQDAVDKGIVDTYTVKYQKREEVNEADRSARQYFGGYIQYNKQGAVHYIEITCDVKV